jgi:hypothetical protein
MSNEVMSEIMTNAPMTEGARARAMAPPHSLIRHWALFTHSLITSLLIGFEFAKSG